jgi:hypothetical protein
LVRIVWALRPFLNLDGVAICVAVALFGLLGASAIARLARTFSSRIMELNGQEQARVFCSVVLVALFFLIPEIGADHILPANAANWVWLVLASAHFASWVAYVVLVCHYGDGKRPKWVWYVVAVCAFLGGEPGIAAAEIGFLKVGSSMCGWPTVGIFAAVMYAIMIFLPDDEAHKRYLQLLEKIKSHERSLQQRTSYDAQADAERMLQTSRPASDGVSCFKPD